MIKFNEVTWYSKLVALVFFIGVLPVLTFYIGTKYQQTKMIEESSVEAVQGFTTIEVSPLHFEETSESLIYAEITSYEWIWKETHNGTGPDSLLGGRITPNKPGAFKLIFSKDGKVGGLTDCNNFSGTYTLEGGVIDFNSFASTRKFCEGSQEHDFTAMIRKGVLGIGENNLDIEHDQTVIFEKGRKLYADTKI